MRNSVTLTDAEEYAVFYAAAELNAAATQEAELAKTMMLRGLDARGPTTRCLVKRGRATTLRRLAYRTHD